MIPDCDNGYMFGCSLAMVISYAKFKSITFAIGHGLLSWLYVLYDAIMKGLS